MSKSGENVAYLHMSGGNEHLRISEKELTNMEKIVA